MGLIDETRIKQRPMEYSKPCFERVYKEHYQLMYRLAYSMLEDVEDARDAVSHVFTLMWQGKPRVEDGAVKGYLLAATHNQCLHTLRDRRRRREAEEALKQERPDRESSEHRELMSELQRAIREQLTEQDHRVLTLHYEQDMTYDETARELGISASAVNKHISGALRKLRQALKSKKEQ